jgi:hypothetical protein
MAMLTSHAMQCSRPCPAPPWPHAFTQGCIGTRHWQQDTGSSGSCCQPPPHPSPALTLHRLRLLVEYVVDHCVEGVVDEGGAACGALVQHAAQRPEVGLGAVRGAVLEQLWGHVAGRAALGLRRETARCLAQQRRRLMAGCWEQEAWTGSCKGRDGKARHAGCLWHLAGASVGGMLQQHGRQQQEQGCEGCG